LENAIKKWKFSVLIPVILMVNIRINSKPANEQLTQSHGLPDYQLRSVAHPLLLMLLCVLLGNVVVASLDASLEARLAHVEVAADAMFVAVNTQLDATRRIADLESDAKKTAAALTTHSTEGTNKPMKLLEMVADKVSTLANELAQETELRRQQIGDIQEANAAVSKGIQDLRLEIVELVKSEVAKQVKEAVADEVASAVESLRHVRYASSRKNCSSGSCNSSSTRTSSSNDSDSGKYTKRLSALEIRQTLREPENVGNNEVSILTTLGDNMFGELLNREEVLSRGRLFKLKTELGTMLLPTEQVGVVGYSAMLVVHACAF
jgi:hypothetical protein